MSTVADQRYPHLSTSALGAVDWFAHYMKEALERNHDKGDRHMWQMTNAYDLLQRLTEESEELGDSVSRAIDSGHMLELGLSPDGAGYIATLQEVIREAADVGNFAMFIADKARATLETIEQHGQATTGRDTESSTEHTTG